MSVDANGIIPGLVRPEEIQYILSETYLAGQLPEITRVADDFFKLNFKDPTVEDERRNNRSLSVFTGVRDVGKEMFNGPRTLLMIGCWGDSEAIMRHILEKTGGYYLANESMEERTWETFIPTEGRVHSSQLVQDAADLILRKLDPDGIMTDEQRAALQDDMTPVLMPIVFKARAMVSAIEAQCEEASVSAPG